MRKTSGSPTGNTPLSLKGKTSPSLTTNRPPSLTRNSTPSLKRNTFSSLRTKFSQCGDFLSNPKSCSLDKIQSSNRTLQTGTEHRKSMSPNALLTEPPASPSIEMVTCTIIQKDWRSPLLASRPKKKKKKKKRKS